MLKGVPKDRTLPSTLFEIKIFQLERLTAAEIRSSSAGMMIPRPEVSELEPYFMTNLCI